MTIAVFGASGYQGKLILAELARHGADLVLIGRDAARLSAAASAHQQPARRPRRQQPPQRFTYLIDAVTAGEHHVRGTVQGSDTYGTTAVIAAGSALRLTVDGIKPGVLAPAQAYDPADFLNSLAGHGIRYTIDWEA